MVYDPDIYFVQTLNGFKRVSIEQFNKINFDYATAHVVNKGRQYDLCVHIKPSFLFYIFNKNKNENMWRLLADKWYSWFNRKLSEIGFDFEEILEDQGE